jgi:integrase
MTTAKTTAVPTRPDEARRPTDSLLERFPPRPVPADWPTTRLASSEVMGRLLTPPFVEDRPAAEENRRRGLPLLLRWLEGQPGETWQQRWLASGAGQDGRLDWRSFPIRWANSAEVAVCGWDERVIATGLLSLICADVIRPSLEWLLTTVTPKRLAAGMGRARDPDGFAAVTARCDLRPVGESTTGVALHRIGVLLAAKGGVIADITPGDCLELLRVARKVCTIAHYRSSYFYQLLHAVGVFGDTAAPTISALTAQRQLSVEQMIARCGIENRAIRNLLVDYLRERQISIDHVTLVRLADTLGRLFWRDLEIHHPGMASLRLSPGVAAAWKQRILTKTTRRSRPDGSTEEIRGSRASATNCLAAVRTLYLDIAQWATDDPARWGPWAVPCPIKAGEIPHKREAARRKSRMDQRTRERMPILPALVVAVDAARKAAAGRLAAAKATQADELFSVDGITLRRSRSTTRQVANIWAEDPISGKRRNLTLEEHRAFWAWAAVEVLRHTGIRIEELTELTHPSVVEYRLPTTGELVPLLHIAPSKTDAERLLVVSPELADALSTIICRVREPDGAMPLVVAYDYHERVFNPPLPLLFQRQVGTENRPITAPAIRNLLDAALAASGLTQPDGRPLRFVPHDFRRIFITDAVLNGMPPHIAQLVVGHADINTTMGYKAVYSEEVITAHRAFIARRRATRPGEEYRIPTDTEWDEFLGHFERRKVSVGTCGRAFGTTCIHEHACIRCPLLRPDPVQRPRLIEIRDNLHARIQEARREGWAGEVEGLQISLAGARQKLAQADQTAARQAAGCGPDFADVAGRHITTPSKETS